MLLICRVGFYRGNFFGLVTLLGLSSMVGNSSLFRRVALSEAILVALQAVFSLVQHLSEIGLPVVVLLVVGSPLIPHLPITMFRIRLPALFDRDSFCVGNVCGLLQRFKVFIEHCDADVLPCNTNYL